MALLGLNFFAYYALTLQIKTIPLLKKVNPYYAWLKLGAMLCMAFFTWQSITPTIYHLLQLHTWPHLMPGELLIFRVTLEFAVLLVGAHLGGAIADITIWLFEKGYHRLLMAFLKSTGLNLKNLAYTRVPKMTTLPPQVVSRGSAGGGKSPSMVAQEAIAKMEAEKKAARDAAASPEKQSAVRQITSAM